MLYQVLFAPATPGTSVVSSKKALRPDWRPRPASSHLEEHQDSGVTHLAWSPDDTKIITCCSQPENSARIWDVKTGACLQCISDFTYPCTTAAWAPDGKHVVIGSQDDKLGCGIWDLSGRQIHNFCEDGSKLRPNDLAISPNGERLVVVTDKSIAVYDFITYQKKCEWHPDAKLTSVTISQDSRHMLVSMNPDMIELMEIDSADLIQRFEGHQQKQFIIRSAFGGADENFVVSGSEGESIPSISTRKLLTSRVRFENIHLALERAARRSTRCASRLCQQHRVASNGPQRFRICGRRH